MNNMFLQLLRYAILSLGLSVMALSPAMAQTVTVPEDIKGPADIGRVKPEERMPATDQLNNQPIIGPTGNPAMSIPEGAENIRFVLKEVRIIGATAFSTAELADIYTPYLNREITLDSVYAMAGIITARYRNAGYFLSLAYLPNQQASNGVITLQVVEGYIGTVELPQAVENQSVIQTYVERLTAQKPLKTEALESFLLRLNDLPGYSFRGILSALNDTQDGAVKLTLEAADKEGEGQISFDNFSSRFLGPNEVTATYTKSLLKFQQTTVSGLTSLPASKLNYAILEHAIVVAPDITLNVTGSFTKAAPGFTLKSSEIKSDSMFLGLNLNYQWIRQRQENLSLKFSVDNRNTNSDLIDTPFTRDRICALRVSANYDNADNWRGYNIANIKLSQGIDVLPSSKNGTQNLSRAQAEPDFTKAELSVARLQGVTDDWSLLIKGSGQVASGPLFSAEEFGFGGQDFGRAFDASEITGDHGVAGALELRYGGWSGWQPVSVSPYAFYDIGVVWNDDIAQIKRESGASAGVGLRAATSFGLNGNLGLAWPLTRDLATPIYGQKEAGPRVLLRIDQDF